MSSRWREFRGERRPPPKRRPANTCYLCGAEGIIWARFRPKRVRRGGRAFVPFPVERCEPGTGNVALSSGLFRDFRGTPDGAVPLAEIVATGTSYRAHREHCSALTKTKTPVATPPAPAPSAFSASSFSRKKSRGGSR